MSNDDKDLAAAADDFFSIFKVEDKKVEKELLNIFVREFMASYKQGKQSLLSIQESPKLSEKTDDLIDLSRETIHQIADHHLETEKSKKLGMGLGYFLSAVSFGIANPLFSELFCRINILSTTQLIVRKLKSLGKQVRPTFIRRRVEAIARQNAGKLRDDQKRLIANIAATLTK